MNELNFEAVQLVVGEPNIQVRNAIKSALQEKGFGHISDHNSLEPVREAATDAHTDLLIVDTHLGGDPDHVCGLLRGIRHHTLGDNPFLPVIALTGDTDKAVVKKLIDAGADHIMGKPVAVTQLEERIVALVRARKPFVVTSDYVGPDRRSAKRRPDPDTEEIPLLEVPNVLRAKATGEEDPEAVRAAIEETVAEVNEHKRERNAVRLVHAARRVAGAAGAAQLHTDKAAKELQSILDICNDLEARTRDTGYAPVAQLSDALAEVAGRLLERTGDADDRDVRLLPELAQGVQLAFRADPRHEDLVGLITGMIASAERSADRRNTGRG